MNLTIYHTSAVWVQYWLVAPIHVFKKCPGICAIAYDEVSSQVDSLDPSGIGTWIVFVDRQSRFRSHVGQVMTAISVTFWGIGDGFLDPFGVEF